MRGVLFIILVIFVQVSKVLCDSGFGSVFPIPLTISNNDPNFQQCPVESGAYAHTTNCSLFHICTFGGHTIYSCIEGFFFNPTSGKCQYWPVEKDVQCTKIVKQMMDTDFYPLAESVKGYDFYHRRKSSKSKCTQTGIFPDILDCSLFHYCHQNKQHEILKCPNGLRFDPKLFMCSFPRLVNCQYEPTIIEDEIDQTSTVQGDTICRDYASGTHLPVANKYDEFLVCENNGKVTRMKCKSGFTYNALTTACEQKPCSMDSTLCHNGGQCVDEATNKKGFNCICSIEYQGEYCEKPIQLEETTKSKIDTSTRNFLQLAYLLNTDEKSLTTTSSTNVKFDVPQKPIPYVGPRIDDKMNAFEKLSIVNSPLSRLLHRYNNNYDQQQQIDPIIKMIFIVIFALICLILFGSIMFCIAVCIRLILSPPIETVGKWNILTEESKV